MSNIIKSVAVVNQQEGGDGFLHQGVSGGDFDKTILKRRVFGTHHQNSSFHTGFPNKDGLLDEINRLRLEAAEARKELRAASAALDSVQEEIAALEEQREALKKLEGLTIDEQAKAILLDAEKRSIDLLNQAKQDAAAEVTQLKEAAQREGYRQGSEEAQAIFNQEHEPEIRRLEQLMVSISEMRQEAIRENETDIVKLIISVAEKIIGRTLRETPETVVDMLRDVMEQNRREDFVKITVSQDLMPASAKVSEEVRSAIQALGQQVGVAVDVEAEDGTLLVETPRGFTDLSVPVQLENLSTVMLEE